MNEFSAIPWAKIVLNFIWIFGLAVILAVFSYFEFLVHIKKAKRKEIFRKNTLKKALLSGIILILLGSSSAFMLNVLTEEPEIIFIENTVQIPPANFLGTKTVEDNFIILSENGVIRSAKIQLEESKYLIRITAYGKDVLGETPNIKMYIGPYQIADYFTSVQFEERVFEFQSTKREKRRLRIEFVNDYFDPEKKLNRNALIQSIEIIKVNSKNLL